MQKYMYSLTAPACRAAQNWSRSASFHRNPVIASAMKKLSSQAQQNAAMTNATIVAGTSSGPAGRRRPDPHRVHDSQQV